jgi:hypothetical protein
MRIPMPSGRSNRAIRYTFNCIAAVEKVGNHWIIPKTDFSENKWLIFFPAGPNGFRSKL